MRTVEQPLCPNCGSGGTRLYSRLQDRLYDAPGFWQMSRCGNPLCTACWLDPAPIADDLPIAYAGYYTHGPSDESPGRSRLRVALRRAFVSRRLGYPDRSGRLARSLGYLIAISERSQAWLYEYFYLPWVPGGRLLEVGCGSGRQLAAMRDAGWTVSGVDFDPAAVAAAQARGLDVAVGDVRDRGLGLEAASFDAIVMAHVLEHVFDPVGLLAECARLLKPGGRLVSITPNARSLGHRMFKRDWRGLEPPRHLVVFTPEALTLAGTRAGLVVDRIAITARDAANLLLASTRIRDTASGEPIERPSRAKNPPLRLRAMAALERLGNKLGLPWGEELVLMARKPE